MEVNNPHPPEAPPPPPVAAIHSQDRFAALDAPVNVPEFPGQPFSVSIKGVFYRHADGSTTPIGPSDQACPGRLLGNFCKRNCQKFYTPNFPWTKLAAQLEVRRRFVASAVSANVLLIHNHIRDGSECFMHQCSKCHAFADMEHKSNLTDTKRHKCVGFAIGRVKVVKYRCGRIVLKSQLPAAPPMLASARRSTSTTTGTADLTVLVPATGTTATARPSNQQHPMNVQMADRPTTSTMGIITDDSYWHSPPGLMAITEDILFQPETEIVPVLDKMMAPLLEGRDEKPNQYMFLFHPFLRDGCPLR